MPSCKNLTSTKKGGKSRKIGGKKKAKNKERKKERLAVPDPKPT